MDNFSNMGSRDGSIIIPDLSEVYDTLNSFDLGKVNGEIFTLNTFENGWTLVIDKDDELVLEIDSSWEEYYPSKLSKLFEHSPELFKLMYDIFKFLEGFYDKIISNTSIEVLALRLSKYYGDNYSLVEDGLGYVLTLFNVDNDVKYLEECIEFIKSACSNRLVDIYESCPDIVVVLK